MTTSKLKYEAVVDPQSPSWGLITPEGDIFLPKSSEDCHVDLANRYHTTVCEFLVDGGLRYNAYLAKKHLDIEITKAGLPLAIDLLKEVGDFFTIITLDLWINRKMHCKESDNKEALYWLKTKQRESL